MGLRRFDLRSNGGFVKLPNKVLAAWADEPEKLAAYCLLKAERDYHTGEVHTSLHALAVRFGWSWRKARAFVADLGVTTDAEVTSQPAQHSQHNVKLRFPGNGDESSTTDITTEAQPTSQPKHNSNPASPPPERISGPPQEEEEEKEEVTTLTTLSGSRRKKSPAPLMSDFTITTGMRAWFKGQFGEVPEREVLGETESFLDHHRAKGNLMVDWAAAWRTWMRNWRTRFGATNGKLGTKRAEVSPTSREGIRARWGNPTWMKEEPDGK